MKKTLFILAIALCGALALSAQTPIKGFVSGGESGGIDASFGMPVAGSKALSGYSVTVEKPFAQLVKVDFGDTTVWGGTNLAIPNAADPYFNFEPVTVDNEGVNFKYMPLKDSKKFDLLAKVTLTVRPCGPGVYAEYSTGSEDYESVPVANHCWTKTNLKEGSARVYDDKTDPGFIDTYGRLYTWTEAVNSTTYDAAKGYLQGICPGGWHLPTAQEMADLHTVNVADLNDETSWQGTHETYTNSTGFTAMPAGLYNSVFSRYEGFGTQTDWWTDNNGNISASEIPVIEISYYCTTSMDKTQNANNAISVRCVKDEE